jgi:hypothetical protein
LPDGRAQFENLGAQSQDPVRIRVFLHARPQSSQRRAIARKEFPT